MRRANSAMTKDGIEPPRSLINIKRSYQFKPTGFLWDHFGQTIIFKPDPGFVPVHLPQSTCLAPPNLVLLKVKDLKWATTT